MKRINMKNYLKICSILKGQLPPAPSTGILLSVAAILTFASAGMAAQNHALGMANELAVEEYAKQYIGSPEGKHVLKGILWVESKYGRYRVGDGSFGVTQIEVATARYVAEKYGFNIPKSYTAVREMLLRDDRMNIRIAAAYLGMMEREFGSLPHAVVAYNLGPTEVRSVFREGGKLPTAYLNHVMAVARTSLSAEKAFTEGFSFAPSRLVSHLKTYLVKLFNGDSPYVTRRRWQTISS